MATSAAAGRVVCTTSQLHSGASRATSWWRARTASGGRGSVTVGGTSTRRRTAIRRAPARVPARRAARRAASPPSTGTYSSPRGRPRATSVSGPTTSRGTGQRRSTSTGRAVVPPRRRRPPRRGRVARHTIGVDRCATVSRIAAPGSPPGSTQWSMSAPLRAIAWAFNRSRELRAAEGAVVTTTSLAPHRHARSTAGASTARVPVPPSTDTMTCSNMLATLRVAGARPRRARAAPTGGRQPAEAGREVRPARTLAARPGPTSR